MPGRRKMSDRDRAWEAEKVAMMGEIQKLPLAGQKALILKALAYNADKRNTVNVLYMGSMATASVMHGLGGRYGHDSVAALLEVATAAQVAKALDPCLNVIKHGKLV